MTNMAGMTTACLTSKGLLRQDHQALEAAEPDIYHAIRRNALLENVVVRADGTVDFDDGSKTENTRVSTPSTHRQHC